MKKDKRSLKKAKRLTLHRETLQLLEVRGLMPSTVDTCHGYTCHTVCAGSICCP